jgi:hypothetical protein
MQKYRAHRQLHIITRPLNVTIPGGVAHTDNLIPGQPVHVLLQCLEMKTDQSNWTSYLRFVNRNLCLSRQRQCQQSHPNIQYPKHENLLA